MGTEQKVVNVTGERSPKNEPVLTDDFITSDMVPVNFSVDSALLQELGEKLVGRPHIALAELIKNSYDADATICKISLEPTQITIADNGNGMSEEQFISRWMRVGTTQKQKDKVSERHKRPLTGSKGVGRLSAQFLAGRITVTSQSFKNDTTPIYAYVNWSTAVNVGELTQACAHLKTATNTSSYPGDSNSGTVIKLINLKQLWTKEDIRKLAQELWMLQSPEGLIASKRSKNGDNAFAIELSSTHKGIEKDFQNQMKAALENWDAAIVGTVVSGRTTNKAQIEVRFKGESGRYQETMEIENCKLDEVKFQIRVFKHVGRQTQGLQVKEVRDYFSKYGGVHVYDSGFRLPYYGLEQDWLDVEVDHSHRRTISKLLPERLHVHMAMNDLPTQERLFGVVSINTGAERNHSSGDVEHLKVQVTRDRLIDNEAYQQLKHIVRWSLDYYARCYRLYAYQDKTGQPKLEKPIKLLEQYSTTLSEVERYVPESIFQNLSKDLGNYKTSLDAEVEADQKEKALLAPLATAGMAALAFEHESGKEISEIKRISREIKGLATKYDYITELADLSNRIEDWTTRVEGSRKLFSSLSNAEDREEVYRLKGLPIIENIWKNLGVFMRGIHLDTSELKADFRLPLATMADWHALFQNIFTNSANALLDTENKIIKCVYSATETTAHLDILDNGVGVDLETANELFLPFSRKLEISPQRKALGLGGVGLGLTIVNMIAESRDLKIEFKRPPDLFSTAVRISWKRPTT